ncbi:MAG: cardiolipin synthase [Desulfobacteraceae bacterium]|nr:cardiolipin synthase [Desulfobacteraceae bacterium]MBC2757955.1 cardiolipin synthase [Desulfobacteraceae bacterium]
MEILNWASISLSIFLSLTTSGHALLNQRTPSSALGWVAVCLMFPFVGPIFYFLFGINRVKTRARKLDDKRPAAQTLPGGYGNAVSIASVSCSGLNLPRSYVQIARISDTVSDFPMVAGNQIEPLHNGEAAYPAMLQTINSATKTLYLISYIFDTTRTGKLFIDALGRAVKRGVDTRVIIDGFGELYSLTRASKKLKKQGVKVARFLPPRLLLPPIHINLRNHRKIIVADGQIGYTGGMNISDRHLVENIKNPFRSIDMHFRLKGPIVMQLEQTFLEDWAFCTGEQIEPTPSLPVKAATAVCRVITDGPNEDMDTLSTILIGAISSARERILIMTPYFLPSLEMISALQTAALRGVDVNIVLPSKNNLPYVKWAGTNMLQDLLFRGVKIFYQPPPFVHTKLFVMDDQYSQIGSANLDPRSLRLNFELVVEIYDRQFANILSAHIQDIIQQSDQITLESVLNRPFLIKLRDALMWLFSPYL